MFRVPCIGFMHMTQVLQISYQGRLEFQSEQPEEATVHNRDAMFIQASGSQTDIFVFIIFNKH